MRIRMPIRIQPGEARWRRKEHGRIQGLGVMVGLLGLFGFAVTGWAAGDPDQAKGIIVEYCAGCHRVPGYSAEGLPTVEAASFQDFADNPEAYPEDRLRAFLVKPHWPMEQVRLSPSDIDNILAFIESLRAE